MNQIQRYMKKYIYNSLFIKGKQSIKYSNFFGLMSTDERLQILKCPPRGALVPFSFIQFPSLLLPLRNQIILLLFSFFKLCFFSHSSLFPSEFCQCQHLIYLSFQGLFLDSVEVFGRICWNNC